MPRGEGGGVVVAKKNQIDREEQENENIDLARQTELSSIITM